LLFLSEGDLVLSFESVAVLGGRDPETEVRLPALRILKDYVNPANLALVLNIFQTDPTPEVRVLAAALLGDYVYEGELEELSAANLTRVENALLDAFASETQTIVRQQILASLGYSSRPEVTPLIQEAFRAPQETWIASALLAMGNSGEDRWRVPVLEMLDHDSPVVRIEAIRAAGELYLSEATPRLIELLDEEDEEEMRDAVIWALSQAGGEGAQEALEDQLAQAADDDLREYIQEALDNLAFSDDLQDPLLLDIEPDEDLLVDDLDEDDLLADLLTDDDLADDRADPRADEDTLDD
jgi:HEAT repeat protein